MELFVYKEGRVTRVAELPIGRLARRVARVAMRRGTSEAAPRSCTQLGYWWHYGWPLGRVLKPSTLYLSYQQRGIALSVLLSGDIVGIKSWVNTLELKVSAVFSNPKAKTSALQSPERWEKKSEDSKVLIFHNGTKKKALSPSIQIKTVSVTE